MLIKWGSIVIDGSGKLGGHVFSKSIGGNTMRTLRKPRNPQTRGQQRVRAILTNLSQQWRLLTEVQRLSWYRAESKFSRINRFGDVVLLTGKNLFNSLNSQRNLINLEPLLTAPLPERVPKVFVDFGIINTVGAKIEFIGEFEPETKYVIMGSPIVSQGVRDGRQELRVLDVFETNTAGNGFQNESFIYTVYVNTFAVPVSGDKIFLGVYGINEIGQRSTTVAVVAFIQ